MGMIPVRVAIRIGSRGDNYGVRSRVDGAEYAQGMKIIQCATAAEVFDELDPRARVLDGHRVLLTRWLYRGVGNAEHDLVPSALRANQVKNLAFQAGEYHGDEEITLAVQVRREVLAAQAFWRCADDHGLALPEGDGLIRQALETRESAHEYARSLHVPGSHWPADRILPLLAMMQHHGMTTRLLDWTRDPWVALFFATGYERMRLRERIIGLGKDEFTAEFDKWLRGDFAVYILDASVLREHLGEDSMLDKSTRVLTAPSQGNPYLVAQQGMFVGLREGALQAQRDVDRRPMNEIAEEGCPALCDLDPPWLRKVTAPRLIVEDVLLNMNVMGYTFARLFPGFDGVSRHIRQALR